MNKIHAFIIINIVGFFGLLYLSYTYRIYVLKKNNKKPVSLVEFLNRGKLPSMKNILVGLVFGVVFGFIDNFGLWMGIDTFYKYIPGDTLTKSSYGNIYSTTLGATTGTFIALMAKDYFGYDDETEPIWLNVVGVFIGCILGMLMGTMLTKRI